MKLRTPSRLLLVIQLPLALVACTPKIISPLPTFQIIESPSITQQATVEGIPHRITSRLELSENGALLKLYLNVSDQHGQERICTRPSLKDAKNVPVWNIDADYAAFLYANYYYQTFGSASMSIVNQAEWATNFRRVQFNPLLCLGTSYYDMGKVRRDQSPFTFELQVLSTDRSTYPSSQHDFHLRWSIGFAVTR